MNDKIRAILVEVGEGGAMMFSSIMIGPKERHFAKKLTGNYDAELDRASLIGAGLRGNAITWVANGMDEAPKDSRITRWTLPGLDFMIHGRAIIYGIKMSVRVNTTCSVHDLMNLVSRRIQAGERRSAVVELPGGAG